MKEYQEINYFEYKQLIEDYQRIIDLECEKRELNFPEFRKKIVFNHKTGKKEKKQVPNFLYKKKRRIDNRWITLSENYILHLKQLINKDNNTLSKIIKNI